MELQQGRTWLALLAFTMMLAGYGQEADFSPDGKRLVFSWPVSSNKTALVIAGTNGAGARTIPGSENGISPKWSPDGSHILFSTLNGSPRAQSVNLKLYDVRGQKVTSIARNAGPPFAWREDSSRFAAISRAGKQMTAHLYNGYNGAILYNVYLPFTELVPHSADMLWIPGTDNLALIGDSNVWTIEQGQLRRISNSYDLLGLGLSPDGKSLLWARKGPNPRTAPILLQSYDLHSRMVTSLSFRASLPGIAADPGQPAGRVDYVAFAPDGKRLALVATLHSAAPPPAPARRRSRRRQSMLAAAPAGIYQAVYTVGMDGSNPHLVQAAPAQAASLEADGGAGAQIRDRLSPSWSRGGQKLVVYELGRQTSIRVYNADGSGAFQLPLTAPRV